VDEWKRSQQNRHKASKRSRISFVNGDFDEEVLVLVQGSFHGFLRDHERKHSFHDHCRIGIDWWTEGSVLSDPYILFVLVAIFAAQNGDGELEVPIVDCRLGMGHPPKEANAVANITIFHDDVDEEVEVLVAIFDGLNGAGVLDAFQPPKLQCAKVNWRCGFGLSVDVGQVGHHPADLYATVRGIGWTDETRHLPQVAFLRVVGVQIHARGIGVFAAINVARAFGFGQIAYHLLDHQVPDFRQRSFADRTRSTALLNFGAAANA